MTSNCPRLVWNATRKLSGAGFFGSGSSGRQPKGEAYRQDAAIVAMASSISRPAALFIDESLQPASRCRGLRSARGERVGHALSQPIVDAAEQSNQIRVLDQSPLPSQRLGTGRTDERSTIEFSRVGDSRHRVGIEKNLEARRRSKFDQERATCQRFF